LNPAKECVDRLLTGETVEVVLPNDEAVTRFLAEVYNLGVIAQKAE
jgi:hypothetical protein